MCWPKKLAIIFIWHDSGLWKIFKNCRVKVRNQCAQALIYGRSTLFERTYSVYRPTEMTKRRRQCLLFQIYCM